MCQRQGRRQGKGQASSLILRFWPSSGDAEYGEYLSSECLTCHQSSGSNDGIPGITAWPTEDFVIAMHAYKQKVRDHPVMQMMAGRLSDEEIAALASYFNGLE
jgi:cytochrome c